MKKIILFVSLLSSYNLLAKTEATLKTGLEINPEFAPIYENKEKNIYGKDISHYKTGYNLRLLDLNIDIKDKGLTFGTQIKSQRNNIALNDWDGDITETSYYKDTRVKNHDLGIKLNAKYVSPEFLGLKSTSELKYYVDNLVNLRRIDKDTNVVEVGPGIGALTEHLARASKEVVAFERDDRLLPVLADTLSPYDNVEIVHTDVLKANLAEILTPRLNLEERLMVVANLPYYITTPIIMHFLESEVRIDGLVIMTQKEVGDRITAAPGTKAYGSLSIAIQYYMEAEIAFIVPKTVFVPQPNVDSAIIKLTRREQPSVIVKNEKIFFQVARAAFVQRRKTLWNNLLVRYGKEEEIKEKLVKALELADIDPKRRGETLSLAEFGRLSDAIVEFFPENN